jgi:hypothetical protein
MPLYGSIFDVNAKNAANGKIAAGCTCAARKFVLSSAS